jgi:predicted molibdopterin-dependent oxidoreductase YjgC
VINQAHYGPKRLTAIDAVPVQIVVDGKSYAARQGETVLTALMMGTGHARNFEFFAEKRAGFCLMGACQDCWLWQIDGRRLRACTSRIEAGMELVTTAPEAI